ncbi:phage minor head protein [Flavobacterium sp.]|uniref:phage minor head protein n=1 Tax=Flavobacterium sp. TaxID=239 RepID=UPI0037500FA2
MDYQKLHKIYERKAYRIVQKHVAKILLGIPFSNVSLNTYEATIKSNITKEQIYSMYRELYETIGITHGNRINKEIEKVKKANVLFNELLLREILLFLSTDGGVKITSVRDTLASDIIKTIKDSLGDNATIVDLQNAIYSLISKSQSFYKWQALRIARTETTSASNLAAMKAAEESDLVMQKMWISVQDNRTRITPFDHLDMNGVKQDLEKPFFVGGQNIQYPGDIKASPGNVINCRCTIAFIPKRDADGMLIVKN